MTDGRKSATLRACVSPRRMEVWKQPESPIPGVTWLKHVTLLEEVYRSMRRLQRTGIGLREKGYNSIRESLANRAPLYRSRKWVVRCSQDAVVTAVHTDLCKTVHTCAKQYEAITASGYMRYMRHWSVSPIVSVVMLRSRVDLQHSPSSR